MKEVHEKNEIFQCNICGISMKRKANLRQHMANHELKDRFKQQNDLKENSVMT